MVTKFSFAETIRIVGPGGQAPDPKDLIKNIDFGGIHMAGQIRVSTAQVAEIATTIEGLNKRLQEKLEESQAMIKNLANTWEGEAATATIEAYDSFAAKYFQNYYNIIDSYVKFLRTNVEQGYFETETANTTIADAFK